MDDLFFFAYIAFYIWVVFFGGAERVQGTVIGWFEFPFMEKPVHIKVFASITLVLVLALYFSGETITP